MYGLGPSVVVVSTAPSHFACTLLMYSIVALRSGLAGCASAAGTRASSGDSSAAATIRRRRTIPPLT